MVKCVHCSNYHNDTKRNGEIAKTCLKCREKEKERVFKKIQIDENGLVGCQKCSTRLKPEDFPAQIHTKNKTSLCLDCLNKKKEHSDKIQTLFKAQVEQKRHDNPCYKGNLIKVGNDHFDHVRGIKIWEVTDYGFWAYSKKAGKTLEERLENHRLELEKCDRLPVRVHLKHTKKRIKYSTTKNAIRYRKRKAVVDEENWKFIGEVQYGLCGCGCGEPILCDMKDIEFDHQSGEKLFKMANGYKKSKKKRIEERQKGKFLFSSCHRLLTKKRLIEKQEDRNTKRIKIH